MFGKTKASANPTGKKVTLTTPSLTGPVSRELSGGPSVAEGKSKSRKMGR